MMVNGDGLEKDAKKFGGRFAGVTPDWHDKSPFEEDDVDAIADKRAEENLFELSKGKGWMQDLSDKGYTTPLIKEVNSTGTKMWFAQDGIDFVADLNPLGVTYVEKATFNTGDYNGPTYGKNRKGQNTNPSINYNPTGNNNDGEDIIDDEKRDNANL